MPTHGNVKLEPHWKQALQQEFEQPYFRALTDFVREEYRTQTVFPAGRDIFRAFELTPLPQVKVVILGQDPYHGPEQAHGLSFSVRPGVRTPPSLRNIYEELRTDLGLAVPQHGFLEAWAQQGVLLLNSILTVRSGQPGSHANRGWETFTDAAVRALAQQPTPMVFLLWGRYAQHKGQLLEADHHLVLRAAHPSPFSAHKGFMGCRHFSQANQFLRQQGRAPIDWQLPTTVD